ncbi:hypothetical protein HA050_05455 [Iodobacter sp. HSC-16F04]|uniref:HEAT repeat domain-containing protein n=1 Tax=Iodobacter violaceini TaxID=3044271 RepID=A0ABX0KZ96_9NEIS|nr:hypothetical protein [Iodobacter violacea]NHQ85563.1 hypothetical protein [Iodobacter violacea]
MDLHKQYQDQLLLAVHALAKSHACGHSLDNALSQLIAVTSNLPAQKYDKWERFIRWALWQAKSIYKPAVWRFWLKPAESIPWVDLCSENGFKREHALRAMIVGAPNVFFFIVTFRRLNDWVPQVRECAKENFMAMAKNTDPSIVVTALFRLLPCWNSWTRMDEDSKTLILGIASSPDVKGQIVSRIVHSSVGPLSLIFSQLSRNEIFDSRLDEIAKHAIQPMVRARAYQSLLDGKMTWLSARVWEWRDIRYCKGYYKPVLGSRPVRSAENKIAILQIASIDPSPVVRKVAVDYLIREMTNNALDHALVSLVNRFAADKSASIAERGKFACKKLNINQH